ncbi:MAG: hypothetical protein O3B01_02635 [Planctomycetota bacterium]|nr:hypothetical protein [Planctomycetota bacterium]MDA1137455.1 hypothetical protein [Planctomycetota bacterium]
MEQALPLRRPELPKDDISKPAIIRALMPLWRGWIRFGLFLSGVNTFILLTLIYFVMMPFVLFIRLKDPIRKSQEGDSYWEPRAPTEKNLKKYTMQF